MTGPGAMDLYELPELYDAQYRLYRDDVPFYRRLVQDYGGPVLELGAGTARLTAALAREGVEVVGLEPSAAMLARGRERLREEGLEDRAELVAGDMREVELGRRFALVLAPFNALMHLATPADQDAALLRARRHLAVGGRFACDLYVPRLGPLGVLRREPGWAGVGGAGSELWLLQEHDPARQVVVSHYLLDTEGPDGALTRRRARLEQRYFTRWELERALAQAGFRDVRVFGDFDRRPFDAEAPRIVVLASA